MARITPSQGSKPDKLMRDAIMVALKREAEDSDGKKTKRISLIADKLVGLAINGDIQAIKEVNDRVDGRPHQSIGGENSGAIEIALIERRVINPSNRNG